MMETVINRSELKMISDSVVGGFKELIAERMDVSPDAIVIEAVVQDPTKNIFNVTYNIEVKF